MTWSRSVWVGVAVLLLAQGGRAAEHMGPSPNLPAGWVWPPSPQMLARQQACLQELSEAGVQYVRVEQDRIFNGKVMTPVWVRDGRFGPLVVKSVRTARAPVMDCEMALALVREATTLTNLGVEQLLVGRVINDRHARLRGRSVNLRSRHSLGLAVDVRAFLTANGQRLTVARDYTHPLVQRVEAQLFGSETFRAVVTRRNDPGHRDHFHLSAKLNLDPQAPEPKVDVTELLRATPH